MQHRVNRPRFRQSAAEIRWESGREFAFIEFRWLSSSCLVSEPVLERPSPERSVDTASSAFPHNGLRLLVV